MGIFDKFKKKEKVPSAMLYNEELGEYFVEIQNILFISEEQQDEDYVNGLKRIANNYYDNLNSIIEFMLSDLNEMYGETDAETVKKKLGRPTVDYDNGTVTYLEQAFDNVHIFSFEFLDDEFNEIQYFAIDG